jgi:hypothetical protein
MCVMVTESVFLQITALVQLDIMDHNVKLIIVTVSFCPSIINILGINSTTSNTCSGNGTCISPDNCSCLTGYYGSQCETYNCYGVIYNASSTCSSNGTCIGPNRCLCQAGFYGSNCQFYNCFGLSFNSSLVCSSNGKFYLLKEF